MIDIDSIVKKAKALCALLPVREVSEETSQAYMTEFKRMWKSGDLDPLRDGIALDTYYHRRAALQFGARQFLAVLIKNCVSARNEQDQTAEQRWAKTLFDVIQRLEPILLLEPPTAENVLPWLRPPSRWHASANADRERGQNSKKNVLAYLPKDWDSRLWEAAATRKEWEHLDALAIHLIVPVRPEELVPAQRPNGWSPGVLVELRSAKHLAITFMPVKSHAGLYGTELTEICINPRILGAPAEYLATRCGASGGSIVVSTNSKNGVRKALAKLGSKALPEIGEVVITPYVLRHQLIADLKATFGGGEQVAAAAGHSTDRTQARYGHVRHGRKRKGYLGIKAARQPRFGNVERGRQLADGKEPRVKKMK
jgi:integrase